MIKKKIDIKFIENYIDFQVIMPIVAPINGLPEIIRTQPV